MSLEVHPNIAKRIIESEHTEDVVDWAINVWISITSKLSSAISLDSFKGILSKKGASNSLDQLPKPPKKT